MDEMIGYARGRYHIYDGAMQFSNFDLLPRPTSNCDFLHLCRLENLEGTLTGGLCMGGWARDMMIG